MLAPVATNLLAWLQTFCSYTCRPLYFLVICRKDPYALGVDCGFGFHTAPLQDCLEKLNDLMNAMPNFLEDPGLNMPQGAADVPVPWSRMEKMDGCFGEFGTIRIIL